MLLAVAGVRLDDSPSTRSSLQAALARRPELVASTQVGGEELMSLDVSPDGKSVATYDRAHRVRLHRIDTGDLVAEYSAGSGRRRVGTAGLATFDPDGRLLAVAGAPPTEQPIRILDATTLEPVPAQPLGLGGTRWQAGDLAFSEDGRRLAAVLTRVRGPRSALERTSSWLVVWALTDPRRPLARIRLMDRALYAGVAMSHDGRSVFTTQPFMRHDITTGTSRPVAGSLRLGKLSMPVDGQLMVASLTDRPGMVLLDAATGAVRQHLRTGGFGWNVAFSADGGRVATLSEELEGLVWDVNTGSEVARIALGPGGEILDLSADGSTLYAAGSDGSVRHWDLDGERRLLAQVTADKDGISSYLAAQPAPRGPYVAVPSLEEVGFLDTTTVTTPSDPLDAETTSFGLGSWHPDGVHYAHAGSRVTLWDASRSALVARGARSEDGLSGVDHSTDGTRLVTTEASGRTAMLDAATLEPVGRVVQLGRPACCVSAGPDNRRAIVLTGSVDKTGFFSESVTSWVLVDLESGAVVDEGDLGFEGTAVEVSPDGGRAAIGGHGGEVLILDLATGRRLGPPSMVSNDAVWEVTHSSDGERIVTSGLGASVGVLDGTSGQLLESVVTPEPGTTAAFGGDTSSVVIATFGDGPIWRWNTDVGYTVDFACRVAGRDFTEAEWSAQFGSLPYQKTCPH